jgi:hypothetical protein
VIVDYTTTASLPAIHYSVPEQILNYKVSPFIKEIIEISPKFVLGETNLFNYDSFKNHIVPSPPFRNFLRLLVDLNELDPKVLTANSLSELNSILQQRQGISGGLLRKEGSERWHLEDNQVIQKYRPLFEQLLGQLGFIIPKLVESPKTVNHCILFGALTESMEKRIIETLNYLKTPLLVTGNIFLLGSNRALTSQEITHIKNKINDLDENQRQYWNTVFNTEEKFTEANAFTFLWTSLAPKEMLIDFKDKLITIHSNRVGNSYREQHGHRVTTEVTIEDWLSFYKAGEPQAIFAIAEQPYTRLTDQLRVTITSNGKKASKKELIERIDKTTFYFASPALNFPFLMSTVFDEIGRNVYQIVETLKYLESLEK